MPRYRIYSETLPFDVVRRASTVALLRRYGLELVLAVRPWQLGELPEVARALADQGVPLSLWPMLADEDGRWASAHNAERFVQFVRDTCDALDVAGAPARDVLLDLEPPFSHARALADGRPLPRSSFRVPFAAFVAAERSLAGLVGELRARGVTTSCAVWPLVALDPPGARGWQTLLGTPVDALAADHVSVMVYTSILQGWSRGALRRCDAVELLDAACARVVGRYGARAGISLGCVGTGALADEPVFAGPAELAVDASVARASGCPSLALFDLGGVLARPPPEAWLDALVHGPPVHPGEVATRDRALRASRRVAAARRLARVATWALRRR